VEESGLSLSKFAGQQDERPASELVGKQLEERAMWWSWSEATSVAVVIPAVLTRVLTWLCALPRGWRFEVADARGGLCVAGRAVKA